ncbi:hypothetical protein AAG570_008989 [Ranatra chinensis]|uniref:Uncharacterized protein n=1 Tax=Ranatra chinensis TaxID=642074 RepID=A0ABD0Z349_9HEMI
MGTEENSCESGRRELAKAELAVLRGILVSSLSKENLGPADPAPPSPPPPVAPRRHHRHVTFLDPDPQLDYGRRELLQSDQGSGLVPGRLKRSLWESKDMLPPVLYQPTVRPTYLCFVTSAPSARSRDSISSVFYVKIHQYGMREEEVHELRRVDKVGIDGRYVVDLELAAACSLLEIRLEGQERTDSSWERG